MRLACPNCGTPALPGAEYCHSCGRRLRPRRSSFPRWKRVTMSLLLGLYALFISGFLLIPRDGVGASLAVGDTAPGFNLVSLSGERVRLSDLAGKPLVLNFWASWCEPCRYEMPDFAAVYEKYRDQGLQFYAINLGESQVVVEQFLRQTGVDLPVLLDLKDQAQDDYRILPIPATFFIDGTGTIQAIHEFQMSRSLMEAEVVRLLEVEANRQAGGDT